jgi:hypothetical protein
MVTHHRKCQHINAEHSGEQLPAILNELFPMIKTFPGNLIGPA